MRFNKHFVVIIIIAIIIIIIIIILIADNNQLRRGRRRRTRRKEILFCQTNITKHNHYRPLYKHISNKYMQLNMAGCQRKALSYTHCIIPIKSSWPPIVNYIG